jgi:UrcA family protein
MQLALLAAAVIRIAAADPDGSHALNAQLGSLDLRTKSGAALTLQRLAEAAKAYCAGAGLASPGVYDVTTLKCRRDMVGRAVRQLDVPAVSAAFEAAPEDVSVPPSLRRR